MTRPCECGLDLRPRRLFGFPVEPVDGAPCFFTGSIAPGGCGLPSTDSLSGFVTVGNGKIQGGLLDAVNAARQAHPDKRVTLWFQDEARVGQKGRVCHRWWTRGQRPPGLCDQRYTWVHLFAVIQPASGDRFALVMPAVSTEAMNIFLHGFSGRLADDEHAVMVLDRAGWHGANDLQVPSNITLAPLPSYSPELNPVERLWLFMRERYFSFRLFDDYDHIVNACCRAWNQLTPELIQSLCAYPYIQQVNA